MTNSSHHQQPGLFDDADVFTMVVVDEPIRRTIPDLAAPELRPGDIILTKTGDRDFAAFDVDVRDNIVTVWTATTDQAKGVEPKLTFAAADRFDVSRKTTTR